nr:MAG TPA: putative membrane protein [Caudoviricetes sp.]
MAVVNKNIEPSTKVWLESLSDDDFCIPVEVYSYYDKCRLCGSSKLPGSDNTDCPEICPNCNNDK